MKENQEGQNPSYTNKYVTMNIEFYERGKIIVNYMELIDLRVRASSRRKRDGKGCYGGIVILARCEFYFIKETKQIPANPYKMFSQLANITIPHPTTK